MRPWLRELGLAWLLGAAELIEYFEGFDSSVDPRLAGLLKLVIEVA
jgi:hypothetical protein